MGTTPSFVDSYVDQTHPVSRWVADAGYQAYSAQQSGYGRYAAPVIGLPMASSASNASQDQQYKAFAAGQNDAVLQQMVQTWAKDGFTNQYWRPGVEMNLPGSPSFAGTDRQTQSDWVAAFQHISTVLHQAAQSDGVTLNVVWNPNATNYDTTDTLQNLYPGNNFVDIIAADMYGNAYPYNPLYDWHANNGTIDSSLSAFIADPVNRIHFWNYPAATPYSNDGSSGHLLSLQDLLAFANQQGKPFAIPETGAGDSDDGHDVSDDAAFPQWLAETLGASGAQIAFVNLWDANAGGNFDFSTSTANKPAEAAAWARYFGVAPATAPMPSAATPSAPGLAGAHDTLAINVSEDAYKGDAQYTVSVDGNQVGGVNTATASHTAALSQDLVLNGNWGSGSHTVGVTFINDLYDGNAAHDRNLYVNKVTYDGTPTAPTGVIEYGAGTAHFAATASPLTLLLSEDAYQGDAKYSISLDGSSVGSGTVTALNANGQSQVVDVAGLLTAGPHDLAVSFLNDAYAGTPDTDRNLHVKGVELNGAALPVASTTLYSSGTTHFAIVVPQS